jgi:hypothetical protein
MGMGISPEMKRPGDAGRLREIRTENQPAAITLWTRPASAGMSSSSDNGTK